MKNSRVSYLVMLGLLATGGLLVRLFYVSGFMHSHYVALAEQQQHVERDILPMRGNIMVKDLAGNRLVPVAKSIELFSLSVTPKYVTNKEGYAKVLSEISGIEYTSLLDTFKSDALYMPPLKHGLTQVELSLLAVKINDIERANDPGWEDVKINYDESQGNIIYYIGGIFFTREYQRVYPEGALLSQVLGFVNDDGQGRYGLEEEYDSELKGYAGKLLLERDSANNILKQNESIGGQNGLTYELSIDRNVQHKVETELAKQVKENEAEGGSVIVMDPKSGEIIAMSSYPTYDVSKFRDVSSKDIGLFDNPSISWVWEPGSIMKPIVMSAAMDLGLVTPDTKETFEGSVTVNGHKIETALRKSYGTETMTQVLENSDNVAMVWVANKLGNNNLFEYFKKFGFGDYTGIDLRNEITGKVLPLSQWSDIQRATSAFGQGISTTPIQILTAYAAIANNGQLVQPHIVSAVVRDDGTRDEVQTVNRAQVIKPEIAKEMRDMLVSVVIKSHNRAGTEGYKVGGKTGTAQIPDFEKGGYVENAYNHSFVGMAPADDPKYVMLVKIDHPNIAKTGMFAESTAVPLFGRLSTFLLNYYQVKPTNR